MQININRLMQTIDTYGKYGKDPNGGITRPSFSPADYVVRDLFIKELTEMGLAVHIDPIANIWGKWNPNHSKKQSIVIGSHLDTVPNGGMFDGALGVLLAKEIILTFIEHDISLKHPLEIISFTAEEPNDFQLSTMGSRAFVGRLDKETLAKATDSTGVSLKDAVAKAGGDIHSLPYKKTDIAAFLELHIEQGKRLETANKSVAVVPQIVGIYRDKVTVKGEANHSGTTMMRDRKDSLVAASEMVLAVEEILTAHQTDAVATIGTFDILPNAANIIPGSVEMTLEIRSASASERKLLNDLITRRWEAIRKKRKVTIQRKNLLDQQACDFDPELVTIIQQAADARGIAYETLPSMAGHDSTHMAAITKAAMIFVKSIAGKSHCPEELSLPEDIEKAANTMLEAILMLDAALAK